MSLLCKKVQDEMVDEKNHLQNKHEHYFGTQYKYKYKILKFLGTSWASVIAHKHLLL